MTVMRTTLIALSRNKPLQKLIVRVPVTRRMVRRFVAGESLDDAIVAVRDLNARGMMATLDHLGENVSTEEEALAAADDYLAALDRLAAEQLDCNVSVKPTHMGLDLGDDFCYSNILRIVRRAATHGNFVRVDMEGSPYTARTIDVYRRLRQQQDNCGIVVQSYLHRTQGDVESLIANGMGNFRLCKGAYDEPPSIAYRERSRVTQAMQELIRTCFSAEGQSLGAYAAVASHDEDVVNFARAFAYQHEVPTSAYEFQMLYGIRPDFQADLVKRGYRMRVYVPYGTHWYPYFMRRMAERPANLFFFLRALVGN